MITVTCDVCGFNNKLVYQQSLVGKTVQFKCKNPVCAHKIKYTFPNVKSLSRAYETVISDYQSTPIIDGILKWQRIDEDPLFFIIQDGVNIVGRKSNHKTQDIGIPTEDKTMSRLHCVITRTSTKKEVHYLLKGYSNKNPILLNGKVLEEGSEIYLQTGDIIIMGKTKLTFSSASNEQ